MNVSSPNGVPDDDYWKRPDGQTAPLQRPEPYRRSAENVDPPYAGPPRSQPPPPHWRPPMIAEPPPPRELPVQNEAALNEAEGAARTVTQGVGLVVGAIALIVMCLLCARFIF